MNRRNFIFTLLALGSSTAALAQTPIMQSGGSIMQTGFCKLYGCQWLGKEELLDQGQPSGFTEYTYSLTKVPHAGVVLWREKSSNSISHAILFFRPVSRQVTPGTSPVKIAAQFTRDLTGFYDWDAVPTQLLAFCGPKVKPREVQDVFSTPLAKATCSWSPEAYGAGGKNVGPQLTLMLDPNF